MIQFDPVDLNSYCETLQAVYITIVGQAAAQLCKFNPRRIALRIACPSGNVNIWPDPNFAAHVLDTVVPGIVFSPQFPQILVTQEETWSECQAEWWAIHTVAGLPSPVVSVTEVVLRDTPPVLRGLQNEALKSVVRPGSGANGIPRDTGPKRPSLWDMVFSACRKQGNRPK